MNGWDFDRDPEPKTPPVVPDPPDPSPEDEYEEDPDREDWRGGYYYDDYDEDFYNKFGYYGQ